MHLRKNHLWIKESFVAALGQFGLQQKVAVEKIIEPKKWQNFNYHKICPIPDCHTVTKNLGEHFRGKKHSMKQDCNNYALLKKANHFDKYLVPTYVEKSPQKNFGLVFKMRPRQVLESPNEKEN